MNRQRDFSGVPDEGPDGFDPKAISMMLTQIPAISSGLGELRDAVREIHRLLGERQKSHLTVEEFAEQTGRKPYTVRDWIKNRRIEAIRVAGTGPKGRLLIPREELQKLIECAMGGRVPATATAGTAVS